MIKKTRKPYKTLRRQVKKRIEERLNKLKAQEKLNCAEVQEEAKKLNKLSIPDYFDVKEFELEQRKLKIKKKYGLTDKN